MKADKNKSFSLGINLDNQRQIKKFKAIEKRCEEISPVSKPKGQKRLLKRLYENGEYTTLYLKLNKDQTVGVKPGQTCIFSGTITFSAIYLGDEEKGYSPSIVVRVGEATLTPVKKKKPTNNDDNPITDSEEEDNPISDSDEE